MIATATKQIMDGGKEKIGHRSLRGSARRKFEKLRVSTNDRRQSCINGAPS